MGSRRSAGLVIVAVACALGVGASVTACLDDDHGRCGRHGHGRGGGQVGGQVDDDDDDTSESDAATGVDVPRVPADPGVGGPDASDSDADPDAAADASAD